MWAHELTIGLDLPLKPHPKTTDTTRNPPVPTNAKLPVAIMGVTFDPVTQEETLRRIDEMVTARTPHHVVTANVDFLVQALGDVELHRILLDAHLVVCDGTPLVWASHALGNPLPERVAGSDLAPRLVKRAAEKGHRLFFLGSTPEANARAVANLRRQHPGLIVAGHYSPPFRNLLEMDHDEIARQITAAKPDIMFVSLGCPKQEKWIAMHYRALGVPVAIGVGAVIDFLAGDFKRAPEWVQRAGAEWIFRLLQEPRRLFRRYALDLWHFTIRLSAQLWRMRLPEFLPSQEQRRMLVMTEPEWQRVHASEQFTSAAIRRDLAVWNRIKGRHCLLDVSDVRHIDSTGIGWLVWLHKRLQQEGRRLVLISPSPAMIKALELMQLADYFSIAADAVEARQLITESSADNRAPATQATAQQPIVQNEITVTNAHETWLRLDTAIQARHQRPGQLSIDLSRVRFIDSSGLAVLIRAREKARQLGTAISFAGAHPNVRNVLRLARVERILLESGS